MVGLIVCGGFAAVAAHSARRRHRCSCVRCVRWRRRRGFRCATPSAACARPGNQTRVILLAVGLGSFFVLGVRALQSNLSTSSPSRCSSGGADMFLVDIQQDQVDGVRQLRQARPEPSRD